MNSRDSQRAVTGTNAGLTPDQRLLKQTFDLCVRKTRGNIKRLADDPKAAPWAVDGNYFGHKEGFYDIGNWTSYLFFTGMALLAWRATEDNYFLQQVERLAPHYRRKVFEHHHDTMHDLGFLYSLYSVALFKLTGNRGHRETALRAADVLVKRFIPNGGYIRAWGRMDVDDHTSGMAIIDCIMNLPLLYWALVETGNLDYHTVATSHADIAMKYFIRDDDTVYHAYRFDLKTGKPARADTFGGCDVESHWARGTAWGIYGFALSYTYTREPKYLLASLRLARKFIASLDEEVVPLWDFKLPDHHQKMRDASAASVAVCGLQELLKHKPDAVLSDGKHRLLARLCSEDYVDFNEACPGVLKNGQVGNGIPGGAQNAYTSWGDYYLMEALSRELKMGGTFW